MTNVSLGNKPLITAPRERRKRKEGGPKKKKKAEVSLIEMQTTKQTVTSIRLRNLRP